MNFDNLKTYYVGYKIVPCEITDWESTRRAQAEFEKSSKGFKKFLCKFIPGCTVEPPVIYKIKYDIRRVFLWGKFLEPEYNVNSEKFDWKFIVSDRVEVHKGGLYPEHEVFLTATEAEAECEKRNNENSADN
jgi:hypothetical protein